jgi:hypothetical protein
VTSTSNSTERPFTAVLSSIVENLEEIVRSEIRLAKAEVRHEVAEFTHGAVWLATGILSAFFAISFLLGVSFFALSNVMPRWIAALIIAGVLLTVCGVSFAVRASIVKSFTEQQPELPESKPEESIA